MSIQGRMARPEERALGMTDAERAWRKQWLQDQLLTPREPILISKEHPDLMNPIRRAYRWPLNQLQKLLTPIMGPTPAHVTRFYLGKVIMGVYIVWGVSYYFMYNTNTWVNRSGWRVTRNKEMVFPGDERFPADTREKMPRDFFDRGFKDSVFGKRWDNRRPFLPDDEIPIKL